MLFCRYRSPKATVVTLELIGENHQTSQIGLSGSAVNCARCAPQPSCEGAPSSFAGPDDNHGNPVSAIACGAATEPRRNRVPTKTKNPSLLQGVANNCASVTAIEQGAEGGNRTHTPGEGNWILNPICRSFHRRRDSVASPYRRGLSFLLLAVYA